MIDRSFKICNNWNSFHNDIESIKSSLIENTYPSFLINKVIKNTSIICFLVTKTNQKTHLTIITFCYHILINLNFNLVFTSFKIKNYFSYKHPIPDDLESLLVYKFTCASCSSGYIGETCCHLKTRIKEHIIKDKKPHIFKHLHSATACFDSYNSLSFKIIAKANSKVD